MNRVGAAAIVSRRVEGIAHPLNFLLIEITMAEAAPCFAVFEGPGISRTESCRTRSRFSRLLRLGYVSAL
jgi:hypothetical protein